MYSIFGVNSEHFISVTKGPWDVVDRTHYRLDINHEEKVIHVTGRCSDYDDWPDNFDFRVKAWEPAEQWFADKEILVHSGFLRQYKSVRNILLDVAYEYSEYAIRVDGFSLGASWPQIFLQDVLHRWPDRDVQAILYAPGNPWRKLPVYYQKALERCTVFVRSVWDPVTWMRLLRFYRFGSPFNIGKWWRALPVQHQPKQILRALKEMGV